MSEALLWLERVITFLPNLVGLWNAVKSRDPDQTLAEQAKLIRAIEDRQMREELAAMSDTP